MLLGIHSAMHVTKDLISDEKLDLGLNLSERIERWSLPGKEHAEITVSQ